MKEMFLETDFSNLKSDSLRAGFGRGLLEAGKIDPNIVALCADLTESTKMDLFANEFPDRFIEVGIAEQNLAAVASGLSAMGKIPFTSSYAAFHPGRSWEQIKTTICLNKRNVKIIGSHAGLSVGPDGATHQMLEDIALMRVMPGMTVICPADAIEAEKATLAMAKDTRPNYLRLARESVPTFTTQKTPFSLSHAQIFKPGNDVTLVSTGTMTYHCLSAAQELEASGVSVEVVHCPVIKPLDVITILHSVQKTGRCISAEEAQAKGGLGGAVAEMLAENHPVPMIRIGIDDQYGQSGRPDQLMAHYKLDRSSIIKRIKSFIGN